MTNSIHLTKLVQLLLGNKRFGVELRWRIQRNGLPQGSVLAPVCVNVYANNQPISPGTRSFIYANDLGIAAQNRNNGDPPDISTRQPDMILQ